MGYRIGVDIGGTFTDFCVFNEENNQIHSLKVLSTPSNPGAEVMEGMRLLGERHGVDPGEVNYFTHGTTVGINTIIQRNGARLCLFTTEKFGDVLELERLKMPDTFNINSTRPLPLITKDRVMPIRERILFDGSIDTPLDVESVARALEKTRALGADCVVISLLNSYRNPAHEQQVKAIIQRDAPELVVVCSSEVWPIIREYERTITAVINGYVQPRVSRYITSLQKALKEWGVGVEPLITKSNGGVMSAELGKTACVDILLSGTAAGVMGASHVAALCGLKNLISLDIGGTSADVALIIDGQTQFGTGEMVGEFPMFVPTVSVTSVGDGGGSVAWVDTFGVLKVGPESAGSDPGPACYGRGGERATITDAFAVCGFLGHSELAYNAVSIHPDIARRVVGELSGKLGRELEATAEAIIKVAVSGMFTELSKMFARYGADPRAFGLLAFGGAGPMLACFVARELGMHTVVIPTAPGVLSALGGLVSDIKNDFIKTVYLDCHPDSAEPLRGAYAELEQKAVSWLREEQKFSGEHSLANTADMRYDGQSYEIEVPLEPDWISEGRFEKIAGAFHDRHQKLFDYCDRAAPVHMINARLVIVGRTPKPQFNRLSESKEQPQSQQTIEVFYDGTLHAVPLYLRSALHAGMSFTGPAVIAQDDSTTCVIDGFRGTVDPYGNIILEHGF